MRRIPGEKRRGCNLSFVDERQFKDKKKLEKKGGIFSIRVRGKIIKYELRK